MPSEADEMVTFRLAPRDRAAIRRLIETGAFQNRSDFLRHAVRTTLSAYGEAPRLPDLDLEGVELPAHEPAPGRARGRARKGVRS